MTDLDRIQELESLAADAFRTRYSKNYVRRPVVIEFCGSPKSGKTSCISSLDVFLRRNGFKTLIISEKAGSCPVTNKHSPIFNVWTFMQSLSELFKALYDRKQSEVDIVLCDRSVFDALCWFEWMRNRRVLEPDAYRVITEFVTLPFWTRQVDMVFVLTATPEKSIEREYAHLLTRRRGSVMNEDVLSSYLQTVRRAQDRWKDIFRRVVAVDTSEKDQNNVGYEVTKEVLKVLKNLFMEQIAYLPSEIIGGDPDGRGVYTSDDLPDIKQVRFGGRDEIEKRGDCRQIVSIAVLTNEDHSKVLVVKKRREAAEGSPERDASLIWVGGHAREEDRRARGSTFSDFTSTTLKREVEEELGVNIDPSGVSPFLIIDNSNEKSRKHLAVCYVMEVDLDSISFHPDGKELVQRRGTSRSGTAIEVSKLQMRNEYRLEGWGEAIARRVFGIELPDAPLQESIPFDV